MASANDLAAENGNGAAVHVAVHAMGTTVFASCRACGWTRTVTETIDPAISHIARQGHDVVLTTISDSLLAPSLTSGETGE